MKPSLLASLFVISSSAMAADDSFKMDGEFGLILTTGNTETTSVSAGLTAKQELKSWTNDYLVLPIL